VKKRGHVIDYIIKHKVLLVLAISIVAYVVVLSSTVLYMHKKRNENERAISQYEFNCPSDTVKIVEPWGGDLMGNAVFCQDTESKKKHGPYMLWLESNISTSGFYSQGKKSGTWSHFNKEGFLEKKVDYDKY